MKVSIFNYFIAVFVPFSLVYLQIDNGKNEGKNMFRKSFHLRVSLLLMITLIIVLGATQISAIPAFARKYKTSCTTCHIAFSKRNLFGEAFRRNGYVMPLSDAQMVKEKPVSLGAEAWKELWPDVVWPGSLPEAFPVAAVSIMRVNYNPEKSDQGNGFEFEMPLMFNFVFGGAFGEDVSLFGGWSAYSAGQNAVGLQRLFFQFNSVAGTKNLINIRVGRFEPGITDGYTSTQRLTSSYPITFDYNASNPTTSQGGWRPRDFQSGIEVNGIIKHNIYYAAGIVNGESKTIADPTDQKDAYLRFAYNFEKYGFDGQRIDSASVGLNNINNSFMIGAYTYWGSRNKIPLNTIFYNNKFKRFGFDLTWNAESLGLLGGMIYGTDDNPNNELSELKNLAYFIEGNYSFYPWLIGVIRFEHASAWKSNADVDKFYNIIPNLTILYRANIRFSVESTIRINEDKNVNSISVPSTNEYPLQAIALNTSIAF